MSAQERIILVIDDSLERGTQLKDMIEFLDAPEVRLVHPKNWREQIESCRLAAVFIADSIKPAEGRRIVSAIGEVDRNIPIVVLDGEPHENRDE
ncbi:MAG: hypothetical protein AAFX58_14090 [Pseudomonadota bacterium]